MNHRKLLRMAQRLLPPAGSGAAILAYHLVEAGTGSPVDLPLDTFRRQLDLLEGHDVVTMTQLIKRIERGSVPPCVVLTFDDAYRNFHEVVWPELERRRLPCTLYAPVGFVSGRARAPIRSASLSACSWAELRHLADAGVEIGSHGLNHLNLRRASARDLDRELAESRRCLEEELGRGVTSFCFPQAKYDSRAIEAARAHYQSAVVAGGKRVDVGQDLLCMPRFPVRRDDYDFERMVESSIWLSEAAADRVRQLRA